MTLDARGKVLRPCEMCQDGAKLDSGHSFRGQAVAPIHTTTFIIRTSLNTYTLLMYQYLTPICCVSPCRLLLGQYERTPGNHGGVCKAGGSGCRDCRSRGWVVPEPATGRPGPAAGGTGCSPADTVRRIGAKGVDGAGGASAGLGGEEGWHRRECTL